jgi:hypothetical protein
LEAGSGQAIHGLPINLAPQTVKIIETVILLKDNDDVVELAEGAGGLCLCEHRRANESGQSEDQRSHVYFTAGF